MKTKLFLAVFLGFFALYVKTAAPSVTAGDSGEFITGAATLSLAHPPSYPAYSLTARAFASVLPWGDIAYKCNLFSAFASAAALGFLALFGLSAGAPWWMSVLFVLPVGFSASFWSNSLVTEVFALNTALASLLLLFLARSEENPAFFNAAFLVLGAGLGNHQILMVMGAALTWVSFRSLPLLQWVRRLPLWSALFLAGFLVNLYLPIRARANPPLNWGQPTSLSRVLHTLMRKDYGSLTLALGETPPRTAANTVRQIKRFSVQLHHEIPWPLLLLGLGGLVAGARRKEKWCEGAMIAFLLSGPVFYVFANLPFTGQSDGIMGRFFILPALLAVSGVAAWRESLQKAVPVAALACGVWLASVNFSHAAAHRNARLVWDYGHSLLRSCPTGSILFLEGGDDAFYSLATLHEARGLRPDVAVHDRGGLVFHSPYGPDFRQLTRDQKKLRRIDVEKSYWPARPVLYSSMEKDILPGVTLRQDGFLMRALPAPGPAMDWAHLALRSLTPMDVRDYRTRALAAFFPYMKGRALMDQGDLAQGLAFWRHAFFLAPDVDWVTTNLAFEYSHRAYDALQGGKPADAEALYREWMRMDPASYQARANLAVALERQGRVPDALALNAQTADAFPSQADPVYNSAVLLWPTQNWPEIERLLERALSRNPSHPGALRALAQIRQKKQAKL